MGLPASIDIHVMFIAGDSQIWVAGLCCRRPLLWVHLECDLRNRSVLGQNADFQNVVLSLWI